MNVCVNNYVLKWYKIVIKLFICHDIGAYDMIRMSSVQRNITCLSGLNYQILLLVNI